MQEKIAQIVEMHTQMRPLILESGINEKNYNRYIRKLEKLTSDKLDEFFLWFKSFYDNEYREAKQWKDYAPQEVWESYKNLFGPKEFPEQIELDLKLKGMKHAWNQRPKFHTNKKLPKKMCIQPEESGTTEDNQ